MKFLFGLPLRIFIFFPQNLIQLTLSGIGESLNFDFSRIHPYGPNKCVANSIAALKIKQKTNETDKTQFFSVPFLWQFLLFVFSSFFFLFWIFPKSHKKPIHNNEANKRAKRQKKCNETSPKRSCKFPLKKNVSYVFLIAHKKRTSEGQCNTIG